MARASAVYAAVVVTLEFRGTTEHAIIGKLRALLSDGIDSECKVVYLLCEIRKLLDKTPPAARPFALNMYCHWALHVDLTGTETIMPFLEQIDSYVHTALVGPEDRDAADRMAREFLLLDALRDLVTSELFRHGSILPTSPNMTARRCPSP